MTDTQIDIAEMKQTMKRMQRDIDELAQHIAEHEKNCRERYERMQCINLVASTQAYNALYDRE